MDESKSAPVPVYRRIAADIAASIDDGRLRPGEKIPSSRRIAKDWGVAIATATKVQAVLQRSGLVEAIHGVGTVVRDPDAAPQRDTVPPAIRAAAPEAAVRLDRKQIVRVATELADSEGLAAVSMRRIAVHLGVGVMSLYHHIAGKEHLLQQMSNEAFSEPLPDLAPVYWRDRLELMCRRQWTLCKRHPWLAGVISLTRPLLSPNAIAETEWGVAALVDNGMSQRRAVREVMLLAAFVRGLGFSLAEEQEEQRRSEQTYDQWWNQRSPEFDELLGNGEFPHLASLGGPIAIEELFEHGLQRHLDGLATALADLDR